MRSHSHIKSFVVVSNRLPVNVTKVDGVLNFSASNGGLATAMSSLDADNADRIWIGWPGIASDDLTPQDKAQIVRKLKPMGCFPVFLSREQVQNFYEGYANDTLWPLFHYFQAHAQFDSAYWSAYKQVNQAYTRAIFKHADANSLIWAHDYHLMLVPQMLKNALPGCSVGFFLHIPFPSFEIFRLLPERKEIMEGLLGADIVGFHTHDYARHFLSSSLRLMGYEHHHGIIQTKDHPVKVDVFPIGIDYQKFCDSLSLPAVKNELAQLDEHYAGQKLILSMDRLDYSKGILRRLEAYESFLESYPSFHKKVSMIMIAVPSRTEVDTYRELRESIEQTVSRINGAYASLDWSPISYQFQNLPFEQIVALHARADIALVTPLRDGMNLVAKEYVACKQERSGVLILSEMAGAIDELPEAIKINPNDKVSLVKALKQALRMPQAEQRVRLVTMQRRLATYNVKRWAHDFIEELRDSQKAKIDRSSKTITTNKQHYIVDSFRMSQARLIALDYDGTLRGFINSPDPDKARPSPALLDLLQRLCRTPDTMVGIVSGRPYTALDAWFRGLPLALIAEHGAWTKSGTRWHQSDSVLQSYVDRLLPILERYLERTPGAVIEQKSSSLVWHYRNVPPELAYARNASLKHELNQVVSGTDIQVFNGNKILEIKPHNVNKGRAVRDLLEKHPADFVMAIGDDYTDEHMFESLPDKSFTVKVGPGNTHAKYQLNAVSDVITLLSQLAATHHKDIVHP